MPLEETLQKSELGKGRSGIVFRGKDNDGRDIAIKVFTGDTITNLVHYIFSGAPNPYIWNEDAIKSAHYRREILTELFDYWFSSKLRIAKTMGTGWNDELKAYELYTELIKGDHATLHHPFSEKKEKELVDLTNNIMGPLQNKLVEAGFDGLVWQAGKGNPVASNNFLFENNNEENNWVCIDMESGVPALIPINPIDLLLFYLPKSIKHKCALFDDVDVFRLKGYIRKENLENKIIPEKYFSLLDNIANLGSHQKNWKSIRRVYAGIEYQFKKEKITQKQADWYSKYPFIWYGREFARISYESANKLFDLPWRIFNKFTLVDYKDLLSKTWKFLSSQSYRSEVAKNYLEERIDVWEKRNNLECEEGNFLRDQLEHENTTPYLTDFGVHIAIKPFVKTVEYIGIPSLYALGFIDEKTSAMLLAMGGAVGRTLYTGGRLIQCAIKGEEKPWVALGTGLLPVIGNAAYPCQMVYSTYTGTKELAQFILYDIFSRIGEKFPIYGGRDTLTEHFFNHIPDLIVKDRTGLNENI